MTEGDSIDELINSLQEAMQGWLGFAEKAFPFQGKST
ncbi:MAG: hypothetical protein EWV65_06875 [Microcystis flos-aquae Ma_QC_C_20070823_S18D]|nr:MAG: hypothetical protein EWV65_06875 [Microcystis flos-aquae Ma_QC_C_20070823_S18D]